MRSKLAIGYEKNYTKHKQILIKYYCFRAHTRIYLKIQSLCCIGSKATVEKRQQ